ncbi:MAG: FAD-dependent oxidoreductase [Sphaerobacteraceae bacterium]|nr:MAG: FAD-dependent oxidoreductase [Sphaerobacteraceae bacterium]
MKDYSGFSFWLETSGDDLTPRPGIDGSIHADIAILGAGFSGLWTAYYLIKQDPSLRIVILEKEIAGFGASGRNGGWCVAEFPYPLRSLIDNYGSETARSIQEQMVRSVDEIGSVCESEGIDAHYAKTGTFDIARSPHQVPEIHEHLDTLTEIGQEADFRIVSGPELRQDIRVSNVQAALWNRNGASVQPAALARGLARAVEKLGVTIFEQTAVTGYETQPRPRLKTERGDVWAETLVLAGEAYLSQLPQVGRQIMPMTSHMVVTEPLPDELWAQIGWDKRQVITGPGTNGGYLNHTRDGRIAFGAYQSVNPFRSKITDNLDQQEEIFAHARTAAREWFPLLRLHGISFTHAWGGVFGVPRDRMPTMRYDRETGIASTRGYTGEGVATSNLGGRMLADQILDRVTELTVLPMATHHSPDWEMEPLRWAGTQLVKRGLQRAERQAEESGEKSDKPSIAQRIWDR